MPSILLHPINPAFITQVFGVNRDVYAQFGLNGHNGVDYRTTYPDSPDGKRSVLAPYWGKVIEIGDQKNKGYGKFVRLELIDGSQCVLGHLDKVKVKLGASVDPGQEIAISDNTGFSTGSHCHFGYRPPRFDVNNGFSGYVDPSALLTSDLKKVLASKPMDNFADKFNGKILVAVEDRGRKWFVYEGKRYEIDKAPAFELRLQARPAPAFAVFINNHDIGQIPLG